MFVFFFFPPPPPPPNPGREATVFVPNSNESNKTHETHFSYDDISNAIRQNPKGKLKIGYTIEFFPEEGKYHYDGHSAHSVRWHPTETKAHKGLCPSCGRKVTVGVLSRVEELADRSADFKPAGAPDYWSLVPLEEIIAEALGVQTGTKKVSAQYESLLQAFGDELTILLDIPIESIESASTPDVAEAVKRVRAGKLQIEPGYDGEYGTVHVFADKERSAPSSSEQVTLF